MSYIGEARCVLLKELEISGLEVAPRLVDLYLVLLTAVGDQVTPRQVHDAWSVWKLGEDPEHGSIVPFDELCRDSQDLDRPYVECIYKAAMRLSRMRLDLLTSINALRAP